MWIEESTLSAENMDVLLYCMSNSNKIDTANFNVASLYGWSGLNGTLNPYILDIMATASSSATQFAVSEIGSLSSAEQ